MRLWHKDFIPVLPREQLIAQWRELSAIAGAIQKKSTPNHLLVNFVLDYDFDNFISYAAAVRNEMSSRGYRTMNSVWDKITSLKPEWNQLSLKEIYKEKMDDEYLEICLYNLWEKYLCGGIKELEMSNIVDLFNRKCPSNFKNWVQ